RVTRPSLFLLCLLPLLFLIWRIIDGSIGANPVQAITHATGDWALRLLLVTLAITPLRHVTGWAWLVRLRRMLGLFAYFSAALNFTTYIWLYQYFDWNAIVEDIVKRPYITVGFVALVLMIPLAVTSTRGWVRRLGARWKQLHRLVYPIALCGVLHYLWLVKADLLEPAIYAVVLAGLLLARLPLGRIRERIGGRFRWAVIAR
ncbi:MAG: protein-methionine-sulfoxide reductase heme-binding subunit MsrQ, partial [Thiohalocapsa sp.]